MNTTAGIHHLKEFLAFEQQQNLIAEIRTIAKYSPLFTPTMHGGTKFRYRTTNCGDWGWTAQNGQYVYTKTHPATGKP